jgi:hypothetical protein
MIQRSWRGAALIALALGLLAGCGSSSHDASAAGTPLVGTFELTSGSCSSSVVTGTYFRMIQPGGTIAAGKFFENPDSPCTDKSYTSGTPGRDGGLVTGQYQPNPTPPFNKSLSALADLILAPQSFTAIDFAISTNPRDPQSGLKVPAPVIYLSNGHLSGQIEAWSAAWNGEYFNQGSPKPNGTMPGLTSPLSGTYDAATHAFVLTWASQVVGGPFNGFTGYWHLQGTFDPAA